MLLKKDEANNLTVFYDSDWAACLNSEGQLHDMLSNWEIPCYLGNPRNNKRSTEYRSMAAVVANAFWMVGLLEEQRSNVIKPMHLYCDSKVAL